MKTAKLKYSLKVADTQYDKGTTVKVLSYDDPLVKKEFPNIGENDESEFCAVRFPNRNSVTICSVKSLEFYNQYDK